MFAELPPIMICEESAENIQEDALYVTCQFYGQLGNQLFQIAAAVSYALDHGYEYRFPGLKEAIRGELNHHFVFPLLKDSCFPKFLLFDHHYEKNSVIYEEILEQGSNLCLHGYYPYEEYFIRHADVIRKLFAPSEELLEEIHQKYGMILLYPTVAVHVRTFLPDDFDPANGIGRTNWDYYIKAMQKFPEETVFLIFSDAMEVTKQNFPKIRPHLYFIEGNPHYFDFYLMSSCNHQITSPKSTFSWWAAWLNPSPDKVVIALENFDIAGKGSTPKTWIQISMD